VLSIPAEAANAARSVSIGRPMASLGPSACMEARGIAIRFRVEDAAEHETLQQSHIGNRDRLLNDCR
jgi:hypothetical protein